MVCRMIRWLVLLLLLAPLAAAQPVGPIPYSALPSCADSGGNHLNANSTTGAITCGTSTSGGSGTVTGPGSSTVGHFATWNNTGGTSLADGGAPAASATTDTTSASNISSGTLPAGRLPALTGDVTSSSGSAATTLAAGSASNLNSGTLAAARGGAGTVNGALKGNGSGVVSQAACADLSNGATGCSTATGTSGATIPLLNAANVWSNQQSGSVTTLSISTATFTPDGTNNHYKLTLVHASCPCTLANPSATPVAGTSGTIEVIQSSTGSDTIGTWGSQYMAPSGTSSIVLSTGANAIDVLSYFVVDSTHILIIPSLNFSH
jgi:hypothetical protein